MRPRQPNASGPLRAVMAMVAVLTIGGLAGNPARAAGETSGVAPLAVPPGASGTSTARAADPGVDAGASDHFNGTGIGAVPPGWGTNTSGGTVGVAGVPDSVDRSLRMAKSGSTGSALAERRLATPLAGTVHAEARVRVSATTGWFNALYVAGSDGTPAASVAIQNGRFMDAGTGQLAGTAAANRWYALRAVLRTDSRRFDLYVDGQRLFTNLPFRQASTDVGRLTFGIGPGGTGTLHVDTVSLRRTPDPTVAYQVLDTFDESPTGSAPAGYTLTTTGGTAAVSAVPSAQDQSLRLSKGTPAGEAGAVRTFPTQTGTVIVQATLRTEETSGVKAALYVQSSNGRNAASIQFSNRVLQHVTGSGAHVLVPDVRPSEWYTIRLVIDLPAQRFAAFVDGRRYPPVTTTAAPAWLPLRDSGLTDISRLRLYVGADQVGTLHADKLMVYRNPVAAPVGPVVDVRAHGATGNGSTDDTAAVQAAIQAVPTGGTVLLRGGVFKTGMIRLKSDMTLWVAPDAMLLGTQDTTAYPALGVPGPDRPPFNGGIVARALVYAHRADRIVIEGGGVINGNGHNPPWMPSDGVSPHESTRPVGMWLARGSDVTIRNVHVTDAAMGAIVPNEIDGLVIADVDIDSNIEAERDGIDVTDSDNVLIERVNAFTDDDAICFKSHRTANDPASPSLGVHGAVVRLSTVGGSTRANGVKFGTASHGAFHDIVVEDVLVKRTKNAGIVITAVDGATVSNLSFRRITIDQTKRAFFVVLGRRVWVDPEGVPHPSPDPRWVSGLRFEDITATRVSHELPSNHLGNGSAMSGTREATGVTYKLYDLLFSNVRISLANGGTAQPTEPREYAGEYPESTYWTTLAPYGFFYRHVDGLTVRGSSATVPDPRGRPMTSTSDVVNGSIN
ncbi:glycoside hydrolase family 28 protein [Plantactinospora sp. GCM10030261]|uniref:glycoside hydrolase family 28 protein n=1 Tax=Plantactinospora sp. GCM10030261 TaxID=3273420 RepID=UPI00360DDED4